MIPVGLYEEINMGKGYPKMKDCMEDHNYAGQDSIIRYLRRGKTYGAMPGRSPKDVFTGETIPVSPATLTDGKYVWPSYLVYYVEKYNLRLPEEFEKHIL